LTNRDWFESLEILRDIVSPEDLASLHPYLYHITRPQVLQSVLAHGLLPAMDLLKLYEVPLEQREMLQARRRPRSVTIVHSTYGEAVLTDNAPLSETALAKCLDNGMTPEAWIRMLNQRVFFWVDEKNLTNHLAANTKNGEKRVVLKFNTQSLVSACYEKVELAAINTGSTIRKPARRGLSTFSSAHLYTYAEWQRLRGGRDRIKELTVAGGVMNVVDHLIENYLV
jgi:hypothetical protein